MSSTLKLDLYRIEFDDQSAIYLSGQKLSGVVNIHLNAPMSIRGVFIHLRGKSRVCWNNKDCQFKNAESGNVTESRTFYDYKYEIPETATMSKIGPGKFRLPFSVTLPEKLPSSINGKFGQISYSCSSNIERPRRFDPKCKTSFTVTEPIDLNTIPDCHLSTTSGQFQVISNDKGSISSKLTLNKRGFLAGEKIDFQVDIYNNSEETVKSISVNLVSVFIYTSGCDRTREKRLLNFSCLGNVPARSSMQSENTALLIPPTSPSITESKCPMIMVEYFVQLKVTLSEMKTNNLNIAIPITIGSTPLQPN